MAERKYHTEQSNCALARGLDFVGDHWSLLIIRDLGMREKHEYKELLEAPEGISTNILSSRLKRMKAEGLINWIYHPNDKKRKLYYLEQKGKELIPIVLELFRWSYQWIEGATMPDRLKKSLELGTQSTYQQLLATIQQWEREQGLN